MPFSPLYYIYIFFFLVLLPGITCCRLLCSSVWVVWLCKPWTQTPSQSHTVLHSHQSVQCVCVCVCLAQCLKTLVDNFLITFSISMYIMCVCLFRVLSRRVGALQISIIKGDDTFSTSCPKQNVNKIAWTQQKKNKKKIFQWGETSLISTTSFKLQQEREQTFQRSWDRTPHPVHPQHTENLPGLPRPRWFYRSWSVPRHCSTGLYGGRT